MALDPGARLDIYEILGLLGAGGMGEVYRARDPVLKREVAIKVLPAYFSQDPDRLRRFEQEAQAAAALNHPNILAIHQFGTFEGAPYLVSELLDGVTLRQLMERGPVPVRKTIEYGIQIAHGLAAAHERNIVHRDLKPENLFVVKDGRVKILDFGLAKLIQPRFVGGGDETTIANETEPGKVMGTVGYMSPEQIRGTAVDHRADIFAFGAILYEMLTGKRAFQRRTPAESMTAILNDEPPALSQSAQNIPLGLQRVIHRCLEKSPEQRFQSASDLAFAIEAVSESGNSFPVVSEDSRQLRPRRVLAWSGGISAILLLATMYYLRVRHEKVYVLRISEYTQITRDGHVGDVVGTDGTRLYLSSSNGDPKQVAVAGGEIEPVLSGALPKQSLVDVSPDGSAFLTQSYASGISATPPLYRVQILGGLKRYLADAANAIWSPDGKSILYVASDGDFHVMRSDGTDSHKLASVGGRPESFSWSPDGSVIRFTIDKSLWEISSNGTNLHQLLAGWHPSDGKYCGGWTPGGDVFVFGAGPGAQIWGLDEQRGYFRRPSDQPIQLTSGPIHWGNQVLSKDGKKIFATGYTLRGELVRFDSRSNQFRPFLGGISADLVSFSRDGQFVAYVSYPEDILWRADRDGNQRVQLSDPPMKPLWISWSPDGSQILFMAPSPQGKIEAWIVSTQGGSPQRLLPENSGQQTDPSWSPDGSKIIFATNLQGRMNKDSSIRILDVVTHQVSTLPGSTGMFSPHWSPDGRSIIASSLSISNLYRFDLQTQRWSTIHKGIFAYATWSSDSHFIYFLRYTNDPAVLRIPATGGEAQVVADLKDFNFAGTLGLWFGLDPTDAPLTLRDVGTSDVYSLTLERR